MTAVRPEGAPSEHRERPLWPIVVAVAVAAGVLGYLFGATNTTGRSPTAADTTGAATTTAAAHSGPLTTTTSPAPPDIPTLAELVPGFEGTLVAHLGSLTTGVLVVWPADASVPDRIDLDEGTALRLDASAALAARRAPAFGEGNGEYSTLLIGPFPSVQDMRPAALSVGSFAWHGTKPRFLAWVEATGPDGPGGAAGRTLWTAEVDEGGALVGRSAVGPTPEALISWGEWGFLVHTFEGERSQRHIALLDPSGSEVWAMEVDGPGVDAAASAAGRILVRHDPVHERPLLINDSATEPPVPHEWAPSASLWFSWHPLEDRVVSANWVDGGYLIAVWDLDGSMLNSVVVTHRIWDVGWTPDGRFIVAPGERWPGALDHIVLFYDTEDGSLHEVGFDLWVQYAILLHPERVRIPQSRPLRPAEHAPLAPRRLPLAPPPTLP